MKKIESELTRKMKKATHIYKPLYGNIKYRTIRYADEVWTPTGIVDSIRFEDFIENDLSKCTIEKCKYGYSGYGKHCVGCMYPHRSYELGMCVTCFECKVSLSDFKSLNGHNFHGNRNYYVVPKDLIAKIENMIPEELGIISWVETEKYLGLRLYRECKFKEITDKLRWQLLYNAMKKWCDGAVFVNNENNDYNNSFL